MSPSVKMGWVGAHTDDKTSQAYFTNPKLAAAVANIARRYRGSYVELGVGGGALYSQLPEPKEGVEINVPSRKLRGVVYGKDALQWKPSATRGVIVVMNPPFARQDAFFNHAASFADTIVWIAGLNIRLWTNEDHLDARMHLEREWLVPPEWNIFSNKNGDVRIGTVVQVWRRHQKPRVLWNLRSTLVPCSDQLAPGAGAVVMRRIGTPSRVGECGILRKDCKITERTANVVYTTHGSLQPKWGTAVAFPAMPRGLHERLGALRRLLQHRTYSPSLVTLSLPVLSTVLSPGWRRLIRPVGYLDGKVRHPTAW